MGFRTAHADEALDYSIDKTAALDWLCKLFGSLYDIGYID